MSEENKQQNTEAMQYDTVLCAAFCGCGKSYLSNNFADDYKELECWEYRKGDFPKNYADDVMRAMGETKYLFISTDPVILNELNRRGAKIHLYYPQNELRNEYLDRFIARASPFDFIGVLMVNWGKWIDQLKELNYCEHTVLKKGQYLQDVL
jgi:hypothetical protein